MLDDGSNIKCNTIRITKLAGHLNAGTYRFLCLVAEFDRRGGWVDWATASCAHWLNWKCASISARRIELFEGPRYHARGLRQDRGVLPRDRPARHPLARREARSLLSARPGGPRSSPARRSNRKRGRSTTTMTRTARSY